jgi:hypothetical protein
MLLADVQDMFVQYNQVIELLLAQDSERADLERSLVARQTELKELQAANHDSATGLDPYVSCFVAMPFSDQRAAAIYEAVRAVLEDKPYFWRVVRADDSAELPGLWSNLRAKLVRAHCYVAILTGTVNPNVMIEIGRMEALERPLLLLRDAAAPELPADLRGLLYEELDTSGADLIDEVRQALARQDALRSMEGARSLSETVLTRYTKLDSQVSQAISRRYPTWQEFIDAPSDRVAHEVDLPHYIVDGVKQALTDIGT